MIERAHEIDGGMDELEIVARRLFSKSYIHLDDTQASAVWDAIEAREESDATAANPEAAASSPA